MLFGIVICLCLVVDCWLLMFYGFVFTFYWLLASFVVVWVVSLGCVFVKIVAWLMRFGELALLLFI